MKTNKLFAWACALLLSCSFVACSDDDNEALLRPAVDIESNATTVSSLTFWWPDRGDAIGWHYVFKNEAGDVLAEDDLPQSHSRRLVFKGLQPDSKYTLEVTAFGADGTSETSVYTAKTNAISVLSTPTLSCEQDADTIRVTWSAITNATSYTYQVYDTEGNMVQEGTVPKSNAAIGGLALGDYTAKVCANPDPTNEAYASSQFATISFTRELGRMNFSPGTYTLADGTVYYPMLVYMEDGSYIIENFRNQPGYDLCFTVNSLTNVVTITNGTAVSSTKQAVDSGNGTVTFTQGAKFSGNEYEGSITFTTDQGTETYTWEALVVPTFDVTIYADVYMSGYMDDYSDYFDIEAQYHNGVITINDFLGKKGFTLILTFDREEETADCSFATGWNTGYFYPEVEGLEHWSHIYYTPGYIVYEPDLDAITITFYAYTDYPKYYLTYMSFYLDGLE